MATYILCDLEVMFYFIKLSNLTKKIWVWDTSVLHKENNKICSKFVRKTVVTWDTTLLHKKYITNYQNFICKTVVTWTYSNIFFQK
jgi:hypothetical protein